LEREGAAKDSDMNTDNALEILKNGLLSLELPVSEKILHQFDQYIRMIEECVHNLTSIRGPENIVRDHFLDSLSVMKYFKPREGGIYGDIGSGAGLPLMPIKIIHPDLNVLFIDSKRKSTEFIEELRRAFGFSEETCKVINIHTTEIMRQGMKGQKSLWASFDDLFVRALGSVEYLLQNCLFLLKKGGVLWMYKGPKYKEEIALLSPQTRKEIEKLDVLEISVPFLEKARYIIKVVKA
jgi:16S rRNA (guanine527-N7)-methyltransferase